MADLMALIDAVRAHAWLAVVGYAVAILVAIMRKLGPGVWASVPARWQWAPAVVLSALAALSTALVGGASWVEALAVALYTAIVGGCTAVGAVHTTKRLAGRKAPPSTPPSAPADQPTGGPD